MKIKIDNNEYELVKNYRDGYSEESLKERLTDYFYDYDYILGDWAYGKLRLKGFYDKKNKKATSINTYDSVDTYIKNDCAYDCRYFILKKNK